MRRPYIDPSELTVLRALGLPGAASGQRASDAERERAAEALRRHHADGRLTTEELEERTHRAYAATTLGDLDQLFADLPRLPASQGDRPRRLRGWPPAYVVPILVALVVLGALTSVHVLWLVWPLMLLLFFRFARRGYWWRSRGWPEPWRRY